MAELWEARRKRLELVREGFPESLHGVPIRYVEDVAGLSETGLKALAQAYKKEPIHIPKALDYLRNSLFISLEELIENSRPSKPGRKPLERPKTFSNSSANPFSSKANPSKQDLEKLTELLIACYPSMPPVSAESMAGSEVMKEALAVVTATREAIESGHAQADFVILSLLRLFMESKKQVLEIIRNNPAFQKALEQSRISLDE